MEVLSQRSLSSTLNPNAPMFVPWAYRTVEDFSDQWWTLVQSSPCFRDYWLQERFHDLQNDDVDDLIFTDDFDDIFDQYDAAEEEEGDAQKKIVPVGLSKWQKDRVVTEPPRLFVKAPKIVNVKVSPRNIHQPR